MVPEGWKKQQLGTLGLLTSGGTPSRNKSEYWGGSIPWVTTGEINFGSITKTSEHITDEGLTNSSAKVFPIDTLLIAMYGQGKTRGKVAKLKVAAATNQACAALLPDESFCIDFYSHYLTAKYTQLRQLSNDGTQKNLSLTLLKSFPVPVPPLPEQKKIARILSTWDKAIETVDKLIENSKQQKKALMQQLLTGLRTDKDNCQYYRADQIFKNFSKKGINNVPVLSVTQDQGVVPRNDLERKINMSQDNIHTYKLVEQGDFIISLRSFQGGLEYSRYNGLVSPAYHVIRPIKPIVDDFYRHYFKSYEFIGRLSVAVIGIRDGKQISYGDFSFLQFPYPNIVLQRKIANILNAVDETIKKQSCELGTLKKQKQALMQQLLTGKRRVTTSEQDFPKEV